MLAYQSMKNKNKKITRDDLAAMVKRGFGETAKKTDNVAYRFELVELQKRVDVLEKKVGVRHK